MSDRPQLDPSNVHRAIGHYVVAFSQLVSLMRGLLARRLGNGNRKAMDLAELAIAPQTATQLADAFFAVCLRDGRLDEDERKIGRSLRARVLREANEKRNDLAHGDWWVRHVEIPDLPSTTLMRIKPARATETMVLTHLAAEDIELWASEIHELALFVATFGILAFGFNDSDHRVLDIFELQDKRVALRADAPQLPLPVLPPSS